MVDRIKQCSLSRNYKKINVYVCPTWYRSMGSSCCSWLSLSVWYSFSNFFSFLVGTWKHQKTHLYFNLQLPTSTPLSLPGLLSETQTQLDVSKNSINSSIFFGSCCWQVMHDVKLLTSTFKGTGITRSRWTDTTLPFQKPNKLWEQILKILWYCGSGNTVFIFYWTNCSVYIYYEHTSL